MIENERQYRSIMKELMRLARTYSIRICQVLNDYSKLEDEGLGVEELEEYYNTSNNNKHGEINE